MRRAPQKTAFGRFFCCDLAATGGSSGRKTPAPAYRYWPPHPCPPAHLFAPPLRCLHAFLLAALLGTLTPAARANPPMVPQQDAITAFDGQIPLGTAAVLNASLAAHIERQQLLDRQYLKGSQSRTLKFFEKTLTVVRGGHSTVFDAQLLGTYTPGDLRWEWSAVERTRNDPDLKAPQRKSFATGSAQTRLYGREHGIAILQADTTTLASEEAAWYPCAFAAQLTNASGVLVAIAREGVAGGEPGQEAVVKRYCLLSHPKTGAAATNAAHR